MSLDLSLTAGASASITPTQANSTSATSQLGGCANLGAAVELDLGGEGGILGFIPVQASGPVFMKNFNLFQVRTCSVESLLDVYWFEVQKCFNGSSLLSRDVHPSHVSLARRAGLTCPPDGVGTTTNLVNQTVWAVFVHTYASTKFLPSLSSLRRI